MIIYKIFLHCHFDKNKYMKIWSSRMILFSLFLMMNNKWTKINKALNSSLTDDINKHPVLWRSWCSFWSCQVRFDQMTNESYLLQRAILTRLKSKQTLRFNRVVRKLGRFLVQHISLKHRSIKLHIRVSQFQMELKW